MQGLYRPTPEQKREIEEILKNNIAQREQVFMSSVELLDPGYCGLGLETGPRDPFHKRACRPHDKAFTRKKMRQGKESSLKVNGGFALDVLKGMAEGLYMFAAGPVYLLLGTFGGMFRWKQIENQNITPEELEANPEIKNPMRGMGEDG